MEKWRGVEIVLVKGQDRRSFAGDVDWAGVPESCPAKGPGERYVTGHNVQWGR